MTLHMPTSALRGLMFFYVTYKVSVSGSHKIDPVSVIRNQSVSATSGNNRFVVTVI
jgi:hypothetical protein